MNDFNKWTVKSLRDYCKERNIKIPAKSKKVDIVSLIESMPNVLEVEPAFDPITEQRQDIIKRAIEKCKKAGVKKILDYFEKRSQNKRLKQVFIVHNLDLQDPSVKEIRICLKYYQETQKYDKDEKLLINQMITQTKYIDPNYIDPRLEEFKQIEIRSSTYDIPFSTTKDNRKLNKSKTM